MEQARARFVDRSGKQEPPLELWPAVVISREEISAEVERLASLSKPANGRRRSLVVHPRAEGAGQGLAPGIQVALEVLKPGEKSAPLRHNSSLICFCIRGAGHSVVDGKRIDYRLHDVFNVPSMKTYWHANDTSELQVRLVYSNAALLEKMNIHVVEEDPPAAVGRVAGAEEHEERAPHPFGTFPLDDGGAYLMPYEQLINPEVVAQKALHWPWQEVKQQLDKLQALGKAYAGRRLYLLYNPATERTNGTTPSFFATMCVRPAGIVDRPHRHTAAAINYYFSGAGRSTVEGRIYEWKAGDLMLSAPGWAVHNHAAYDQPVYELTVQDSPLNIAMNSLLWQENLREPPSVLGSETGFETNRQKVG
jgi:gentisate 1,2-dioxygenase